MKKNVKKNIFAAGGFSRFFFWLLLGPQWTHSKRFCSYYSKFQKKILRHIYIHIVYMLKKIYLHREGVLHFFFGDHWDPNEAIPTGFAHITVLHKNPPLINLYFEKKKRVCSGGWNGVFFLVVIGTPMNTFQQVSLWWQLFRRLPFLDLRCLLYNYFQEAGCGIFLHKHNTFIEH